MNLGLSLRFNTIPVIKIPKDILPKKEISFRSKTTTNAIEYVVYVDDKRISFDEAMNLLSNNKSFINKFIAILRNVDFEGYFLEIAPSDRLFEFTLVNAPRFRNIRANPAPFRNKLKDCDKGVDVVSFMNLSGTSELLVPCPIVKDKEVYAHISNFVRYAPTEQIHSLLKEIPVQVDILRSHYNPIWVNTHGLGVYWLHLRLDSVPKYYQTRKYKRSESERDRNS